MTEQHRITYLEGLESAEPRPLLDSLLHDGIDFLHTLGLLTEELEYLLNAEPVSQTEAQQSLTYIREELRRYYQVLVAAILNQEMKEGNNMKKVFVIEKEDNVGTAVGELIKAGDDIGTVGRITDLTLKANADIPFGHKVALRPIPKGETILKYGLSIGNATEDIQPGDHVHVHNVESNRGRGDKAAADATKAI